MSDEELTREAIDAYHSKGNSLWSGDLVNKGSFLTQVKLFTFFDGSELPFEIDGSLNIKTRMPFSKARMILPRPMFDPALPMISKVAPLRYKNLAYLYTEVRGVNDVNNNASKTAEFLLMHEWVAVIQTSKETKMYLFPTCSLSQELGITHKNHPQMLHGLFVKFLVNKGTQTPQGYTVEQLYKAGLAKPDKHITRDKVTLYQARSDPQDHMMLSGPDVEQNGKISDFIETSKSSDTAVKTVVADIATSIISDTLLTPATVSSAAPPTAITLPLSTTAGHATTALLPAATASTSGVTASASTVTMPLPATTTSAAVPVSNACSTIAPIVISDTTLTSTPTKIATGRVGVSQPNDESMATPTKCTEQRIGQKRSAADTGGAGTPKRTREMLRSSLQQLLEGRGSISEDETPRTPTKSSNNVADVKLDNITVTDEVFQHLESAMSMISSRELHSVIKPQPTSSSSLSTKHQQPSDSSMKQQQPVETGSVVTSDNDKVTCSTSTAPLSSVAATTEDKTGTVQASTQSQFNVPTVVYNKPCKKPKSILKGGNKIEQLDDANVASEDSPTTPASAKVPRKIGLAEYKKRHKERRDSEDVAEDAINNSSAMEVVVESTSKDGKTSVSSTSPTDHLMIIEDTESALDDTATSKANSDVSVSLKEEKKGDSTLKSEAVISKSNSISKPVKIPPHPMSVLAPSSSTIITHKYPSSITDLSMPYFPGSAFRHDWGTNYPIFGGLSRPYLMPHPPTAPLPSNILTAPMLPTIPPPVVYEQLPSVSNEKADAEMARVEGLKEMFTKNLQNKLKDVIHSDGSSRESSPQPRRSRSLSRSQSPPPRSSRRARSPRRSRRSNSRSQSLDSCRGSDREQIRSRSKSPRSHKSHRSRRHVRSSSRDSSVEDRRHFRNLKRRNDKRRDHKTAISSKTISTQTEENTYKSGDTKRLSEKEVQTDKLQFVHSKGLQTYPMFENHKAVQVDSSVASNFYADFAQYLETYPIDMFNFSEILSNSIRYFEQEISKAFPCNKTLTTKQLKRILEFNHMKKLRSKLSTLLKESQSLNPYMVNAYRPGTPLLDDNQSGVNLIPSVSEEVEGNEQPLYEDESSGLSNSEILSDSDDSNDNVPNLSELLSQYQNNGKLAQTQEQTVSMSPAETSHTTPTKSKSDEAKPSQPNSEAGNSCSVKGMQKMTGQLDDVNTSKITVKKESSDLDKSFIPDSHKLSASPHKTSPPSSDSFKTDDHTYSEAGSSPSGTPLKVEPDPSKSKTDGTLLTVIQRTKTSKGSSARQKKTKPEIPLCEDIYQSVKKGCEEFLSSTAYGPDQCCTGEVGNKVSVESDHDTVDMEISLTDSQNDDDSQGSASAEEKVNDEAKSQSSKSTQGSMEDKNAKGGGSSTNDNKGKATSRNGGSTKDLHHYNSYHAVPLHYHAQPFKYRPQRPQLMYHGLRPDVYSSWDWRRGYGAWGPPPSRVIVSKTERERQILREHVRIKNLLNSR